MEKCPACKHNIPGSATTDCSLKAFSASINSPFFLHLAQCHVDAFILYVDCHSVRLSMFKPNLYTF